MNHLARCSRLVRSGAVVFAAVAAWGCASTRVPSKTEASGTGAPSAAPAVPAVECFLLYELGVGEVRRAPAVGCGERVSPMSTFKIPHALAALDSGVVSGASTTFAYDGAPVPFPSWARDHTLASAIRNSVVWYFQRVADALGPEREREYLEKFAYGNQDPSSNPRRFWVEGSLRISPDEQEAFLVRLYSDDLPVRGDAMDTVRELLVQPGSVVVNATGEHPFAAPWPAGTVVGAKTGAGSYPDGAAVQWIVGAVRRAARAWVFVSCRTGRLERTPLAAVDQAARALHEEGVL